MHLRVDGDTENDLITSLIVAARDAVENYTWRALITQTRMLTLDKFQDANVRFPQAGRITLWGGNVSGVVSVKYIDGAGVQRTIAGNAYRLVNRGHDSLAYLVPAVGFNWPGTLAADGVVEVQYEVGYGDAPPATTPVPAAIVNLMKMHVAWHYEHREAPEEASFQRAWERLLSPYRLDVAG